MKQPLCDEHPPTTFARQEADPPAIPQSWERASSLAYVRSFGPPALRVRAVVGPRFDEADGSLRVLAQPRRQDAARRTSPEDRHVVRHRTGRPCRYGARLAASPFHVTA